MGVQPDLARGAVRLSFGANNTLQQAEEFLIAVAEVVNRLSRLTAVAV
jgi:cysteine desulfurase